MEALAVISLLSGTTLENEGLQRSADELRKLSEMIVPIPTCPPDLDHQALQRLAQECRQLSQKILGLVQSISELQPRSKVGSYFKAIDTHSLRKPLKGLEERLHKCRVELQLQHSNMLSKDMRKDISSLSDTMIRGYDAIHILGERTAELQRGLNMTSISPYAQSQLREHLGLTVTARAHAMQYHVRKSLAFTEMHERSEVIPDAHRDTFAWLLDPIEPPDTPPLKQSARKCFHGWLGSGAGIFHVSGKLGSGKSTLMKFIANDLRTHTMLSIWAIPQKFVIARFFFWKPAQSRLPRSVPGLLRTLAYDILKEASELASLMFPTQRSQLNSLESSRMYDCDMSPAEVGAGLDNLLHSKDVQAKYRFCFFIDALDELDDRLQETHRELVELVNRWTTNFPKMLKICVSSREHNVFEFGFDPDQKMRLQDLTRDDMLRVAHDRLNSIEGFARRQRLPDRIVAKSEGVFLWVTLVLKNVRQGLDDGWDLATIEAEIEASPIELDDLYGHLLKSISKTQKRRANQLFAMVSCFSDSTSARFSSSAKLSLHACLYLEEYERDPHFIRRRHTPNPDVSQGEISDDELLERHAQRKIRARRLIQGSCRGMIEVRQFQANGTPPYPKPPVPHLCVHFVHRSAIEFLQQPESQKIFAHDVASESFHAIAAITQLHLAEFKNESPRLIDRDFWECMLAKIVSQRTQAKIDHAPYDCLEEIGSIYNHKFERYNLEVPSDAFIADAWLRSCRLRAVENTSLTRACTAFLGVCYVDPVSCTELGSTFIACELCHFPMVPEQAAKQRYIERAPCHIVDQDHGRLPCHGNVGNSLKRALGAWFLPRIVDAMKNWYPVHETIEGTRDIEEYVAWQHYPRIPLPGDNGVVEVMSIVQFLESGWAKSRDERKDLPLLFHMLQGADQHPKHPPTVGEPDTDAGKSMEEWHRRRTPEPIAIQAVEPSVCDNIMSAMDRTLSASEVEGTSPKKSKSFPNVHRDLISHGANAPILLAIGIICAIVAYWLTLSRPS